MIRAFFADFYGTLVHEDGAVIKRITEIIRNTGNAGDDGEIGAFWREDFQNLLLDAYGDRFETQRALERRSIEHTLERFGSSADAEELSNLLFDHWIKPPIFEESKDFLETSPVPVYIVSNIDKMDIHRALDCHALKPSGVYTSEDARAYKPRRELFQLALDDTGLRPEEVIHIGDSVSSDVKGVGALKIRALWLNRSGRKTPDGVTGIADLLESFDYLP